MAVTRSFRTSERRRSILEGFLRHRRELREVGLFDAMQWIDGGFLDQKPTEPGDVDVVTLLRRPSNWTPDYVADLAKERPHLFQPAAAKQRFLVEPFFVDLDQDPKVVVRLVAYWFGFLSHQRVTRAWRGLLQLPLASLDDDARAGEILQGRVQYDPSA